MNWFVIWHGYTRHMTGLNFLRVPDDILWYYADICVYPISGIPDIGYAPISGIPDIGCTPISVYCDIMPISVYTRYRVYPISGKHRYRVYTDIGYHWNKRRYQCQHHYIPISAYHTPISVFGKNPDDRLARPLQVGPAGRLAVHGPLRDIWHAYTWHIPIMYDSAAQ